MADSFFSQQNGASAEGFGGANDRAKVSRVLNAGDTDEQGIVRRLQQVFKFMRTQFHQRGYSLGRLSADGANKDFVGQQQDFNLAADLWQQARGVRAAGLR